MKRLFAILLSIIALSTGWLGVSGLPLLFALVPLLYISAEAEHSRGGWWQTFGCAFAIFAGWNCATIWWVGFASVGGSIAAGVISTLLMMVSFMLFHTVRRRASPILSYVILISSWITIEYAYTYNDISWPWLLLGNGFSNDIWAVQWYEYTGLYGGSFWVLLTNVIIYEALRKSTKLLTFFWSAVVLFVPLLISIAIYFSYEERATGEVEVSVIQPNIDCYDKFNGSQSEQERIFVDLLSAVPASSDFVFMPETSLPDYYVEGDINNYRYIAELRDSLKSRLINTMLISGANTLIPYKEGEQSWTARRYGDGYIDIFNSAIGLTPDGDEVPIHHKSKLVIGVEHTPAWIFDILSFLVIDLGGVVGQIGVGDGATVFTHRGVAVGSAICYEGLYGDYYADFVRGGADFMAIISNDGWWGDTVGHRHLFSMSALRAVETRRAIARSANTGISGFISSRGDTVDKLGWDKRGVLTHTVPLLEGESFYVRYGDYVARLARLVAMLSLLYYLAFIFKRRNYLD